MSYIIIKINGYVIPWIKLWFLIFILAVYAKIYHIEDKMIFQHFLVKKKKTQALTSLSYNLS